MCVGGWWWENQIRFPGTRDTMLVKVRSEWRGKILDIFLQGLVCSCKGLSVNWRAMGPETGGSLGIDEKCLNENRSSEKGKTKPGKNG